MSEIYYTISGRLVKIVLKGQYSVRELLDTVNRALDEAYTDTQRPCLVLVDARATEANRPTTEVKDIGYRAGRFATRVDRLAVITATPVHHGLTRMALAIAELAGLSSIACKTPGEAYAFLGLDSSGMPVPASTSADGTGTDDPPT